MRAYLTVVSGSQAGQRFALSPGSAARVGRTKLADFVVPDDSVMSAVHFGIRVNSDGTCEIRDLQSTNGIFVNDKQVSESAVGAEDSIRAGRTRFLVVFEKPSDKSDASVKKPKFPAANRSSLGGTDPNLRVRPANDSQSSGSVSSWNDLAPVSGPESFAVLRVTTGPAKGSKFTLRPGMAVRIGRTTLSEFVIDADDRLSGVHFGIRLNYDGTCDIRDLDSTNGLFMNDKPVAEATVAAGQTIRAGQSQFVVERYGQFGSGGFDSVEKSAFPPPGANEPGHKSDVVRKPAPPAKRSPDAKVPSVPATDQPCAVLRVTSAEGGNRELHVTPDRAMTIGRSPDLDLSVPADDRMSGRHFAIRIGSDGMPEVRDLGSTNGTFVKGRRIEEACLKPGDTITAGRTTFEIALSGPAASDKAGSESWGGSLAGFSSASLLALVSDWPESGAGFKDEDEIPTIGDADVPARVPSVLSPSSPAPASPTAGEPTAGAASTPPQFTSCPCDSGLWAYQGVAGNTLSASELAGRLGKIRPMYLIADLARFDEAPARDPNTTTYLFDWLRPEWITEFSPIFAGPENVGDQYELMANGWGKDAVVCLFSMADRESLLARIRQAARGADDQPFGSLLTGCCWPSSLSRILSNEAADAVDFFMSGIDAVLVEMQTDEGWQVFSGPGFRKALAEMGFKIADVGSET